MKTTISFLLVLSFLLAPYQARSQDHKDNPVAICIVLGVGLGLAYGIWKLCDKIPKLEPVTPPPAPPTNPVPVLPTNSIPTNTVPKKRAMMIQSGDAVLVQNIAASGYVDSYANVPVKYTTMFAVVLESSSDIKAWTTECTVTGYLSSAGSFVGYWTNGVPALTTYAPINQEQQIVDFGLVGGASKFYRLRKP